LNKISGIDSPLSAALNMAIALQYSFWTKFAENVVFQYFIQNENAKFDRSFLINKTILSPN